MRLHFEGSGLNSHQMSVRELAPSFIADPEDKDFSENILQNVALLLKSPYFEKDEKWKVLMGDQSIFVSIEDVAFMNQVLSRDETFATGDALVADIVMTQSIENNKIVTSYKVTKVLEHKNSLQQLSMLLFQDPKSLH